MYIYCVENLHNGKMYVGITKKDVQTRFREHVGSSKNGSQFQLHQAIRKHGSESFDIVIIEKVIEPEKGMLREQFWIKNLNTFQNGYNMTLGGEGSKGVKRDLKGSKNPMFGKKHSTLSIEKNRLSNLEFININGSKKHTEESKQLISKRKSKTWMLTDIFGNTTKVSNLWQFCKENELDACHLYKVAKGKLKQHKGYKCYEVNI